MDMMKTLKSMALVAVIGFAAQALGNWDFGFTAAEGYLQGSPPTSYNTTGDALGEWSTGADDASIVENEALVLDTGEGELTWTPHDAADSSGNLVLIQQDMVFVAALAGEDPPDTADIQTGVYLQEEIDGENTTYLFYGLVAGGWLPLANSELVAANNETYALQVAIDYGATPSPTVSFYIDGNLMTIGSGSDTAAPLNTAATAMTAVAFAGTGTIDNFSGSYGTLHEHEFTTNYTWAVDYSFCIASNACECGAYIATETVATTYEVTTPPTVDDFGVGTYTATFVDFPTQTKTIQLDKLVAAVIQFSGNKGYATVDGSVPEAYYVGDEIVIVPSNGYLIAQISMGGVAIAETLGLTSFTTNLTTEALVATFAKEDAWWVDPGVFKKVAKIDGFFEGSENLSQFGLSEAKGYLGASRSPSASSSQVVVYRLADLNAATPTTPAYVSKSLNNGIYFGESKKMANRSVSFVGDYLVGGNILDAADWSLAYKLPADGVPFGWQDAESGVVKMTASDGVGLTFIYQAPDNAVYATVYKGTSLGRYTLNGTTLQLDTDWGTDGYVALPDGSYGVAGAVIGAHTNVYVCTGSQGVFVIDAGTDTPAATLLLPRPVTGRTQNMRISGTADNTPRLIVTDADASDAIKVFDLADDGLSLVTTTPVAVHDVADLGGIAKSGYSPISGTDDDLYGYLGYSLLSDGGPKLITLRHTAYCPTTATQTVGNHGSSTVRSATIYVYPEVNNSVIYTADAGYRIAALALNSTEIAAAAGATAYTVENIATDDAIVVTFEEIPATISQALVGDVVSSVAAEITEVAMGGSFSATYTATNGWISSIYTNGAPAYDCSANPDTVALTLSDLSGDVAIVVATSEERPLAGKWFESPGLKNKFAQVGASSGDHCAGFLWDLDASDTFLATPVHFTGNSASLYTVKALEAGASDAINSYSAGTLFDADVRGAAVSKPLNVQLIGSAKDVGFILSLPLNSATFAEEVNAFKIYTSNGTTPDSMNFTPDGQYLYANAYNPGAGRNFIYKYRVLDGLKSSGTNLVLEASWVVGSRVRGMTVARIDGKDIVYINSEGSLYLLDTSSAEHSAQSLGVAAGNNYANLAVAGVAAGTPRLYAFNGGTGDLNIYTIKGDYTLETTPFKSYSGAELGAICGHDAVIGNTGVALAVTDDEATLFLGANVKDGSVMTHDLIFVIQFVDSFPQWLLECGLEGDALAGVKAKYTAWAATQSVSDLLTTDYSAQFLMNSAAEESVVLVITAISIDAAGNVTLEIEGSADGTTLDLAEINGILYLRTADAVTGPWVDKTFGTVSANIGVDGVAAPEFAESNGQFFKAAVDFAAPAEATALVSPAE